MKLGIAFAGGGVRGAAHLGILQALEEHDIIGDMYAGTSAGAIVATMKALGYSNEDCLAMMEQADKNLIDIAYWDILKNMPGKFKKLDAVLKGEKLQKYLLDNIGEKFLMNVKKGLSIISTDVNSGAQVIFTSENLKKNEVSRIDNIVKVYDRYTPLCLPYMVYASCALPAIFRPFTYNNMTLVDGSVTNNLPANVLKLMGAEKVIAIDLAKRNPRTSRVSGIFNIVSQSAGILIGQNAYLSTLRSKNVLKLNPDVSHVGLLEFGKTRECYESGYAYGLRIAPIIKKELESQ